MGQAISSLSAIIEASTVLNGHAVLCAVVAAQLTYILCHKLHFRKLPALPAAPVQGPLLARLLMGNMWEEKGPGNVGAGAQLSYLKDHPVVQVSRLGSYAVVTRDPDDIAFVLSHPTHVKASMQKLFKPYLGEGLFSQFNAAIHRQHRKNLSGIFTNTTVRAIAEHGVPPHLNEMLGKIRESARRGEQLDIYLTLRTMTLSLMFETMLQSEKDIELRDRMLEHFVAGIEASISPLRLVLPEVVLVPQNRVIARTRKMFADYLDRAFETRKPTDELRSILQHMQSRPDLFNKSQVLDHTMTFLLGGSDTTSNTLLWIMIHLAHNPLAQEELLEELRSMMPLDGSVLDPDVARKCKTLINCIRETQRLTYPASELTRGVAEDTVLPGSHIYVPAGTEISAAMYSVGRDKSIWGEDANEYRPSRWTSELEARLEKQPFFIPFGIGHMNCPGQALAMMLLTMTLGGLIRRFEWSWPAGQLYPPVGTEDPFIIPKKAALLIVRERSE